MPKAVLSWIEQLSLYRRLGGRKNEREVRELIAVLRTVVWDNLPAEWNRRGARRKRECSPGRTGPAADFVYYDPWASEFITPERAQLLSAVSRDIPAGHPTGYVYVEDDGGDPPVDLAVRGEASRAAQSSHSDAHRERASGAHSGSRDPYEQPYRTATQRGAQQAARPGAAAPAGSAYREPYVDPYADPGPSSRGQASTYRGRSGRDEGEQSYPDPYAPYATRGGQASRSQAFDRDWERRDAVVQFLYDLGFSQRDVEDASRDEMLRLVRRCFNPASYGSRF